jgi:hypothetical protein
MVSISGKMNKFCTLTWFDDRNGAKDIYLQKIAANGSFFGYNKMVNDDIGASNQGGPRVDLNDTGDIIISWADGRNSITGSDPYYQRINSIGILQGTNQKIISDSLNNDSQSAPDVGIDDRGNFSFSWIEKYNFDDNVFGKWFGSSGTIYGTKTLISDSTTWRTNYFTNLVMNSFGRTVITWDTEWFGYYRIYNKNGIPISNQLSIIDSSNNIIYPHVGICDEGKFAIAWLDYRNGNADIYLQRYSELGSKIGNNINLIDDQNNAEQYAPTFDMNDNRKGIAAWIDERNGKQEVWAQIINIEGTIIGNNIQISNSNLNGIPYTPKISINNNGESFVIWLQKLSNSQLYLYGQKIDSLGNLWGSNFLLVDTLKNKYSSNPHVSCNNNIVVLSWDDLRRKKGTDIFAKIFTWDWNGIINSAENLINIPLTFGLENNFPNPFNSKTTINFTLQNPSEISIIIYNIQGKKIKSLISGNVSAGKHSIFWEGQNDQGQVVSSGVYFYKLEISKNTGKIKKMLHIK